jgi:hypothetical protein
VSYGAESAFKATETGTPKIQGIDVIAFGPGGALLIGDGKGSQVVAIDTKDTKAKPWTAKPITKLEETLAGKLGTLASNVEIAHMTVNRASGTAYLAVRKQDERKTVIMTVDGDGKVGEVSLENVAHVVIPLPKGDKASVSRVTDLAWAKNRILVGAVANEEFASKIYTIPVPLDATKKASGFSTETYHVAHRRWETKAPMTTILPLERKGKEFIVGAFACTPVVRYSIDNLKAGEKAKGQSVVELGNGNQPRNMFTYDKDGKSYVLINNFRPDRFHKRAPIGPSQYWVARINMEMFDEEANINEKAQWRADKELKPITDKVKVVEAFHGVAHMDRLNDKQALVLKHDAKGGSTLAALDLP